MVAKWMGGYINHTVSWNGLSPFPRDIDQLRDAERLKDTQMMSSIIIMS